MTDNTKAKQKKIEECTAAELRSFATDALGLTIPSSMNRNQIMAKMQPVWDKDEITIIEVAMAEHPPVAKDKDEDYVTVIIHKHEGAEGDIPVWVNCNGRGMWIERGKPQRIHKRYEHILKNAVRQVGEQQYVNGIPTEVTFRDVQSYPYQIVA